MHEIKVDKNILLRALRFTDCASFFSVLQRDRRYLAKWLPWVNFRKTEEDVLRYIAKCLEQNQLETALFLGIFVDDEFVGELKVHTIDNYHRIATVGAWVKESHQSKGVVTRSLSVLIDHLFEKHRLNRIEAKTSPNNLKSQALLGRLGFQLEGLSREKERIGQDQQDCLNYGLTLGDWTRHLKNPRVTRVRNKLIGKWRMCFVHGYRNNKKLGSWEKQGLIVFSPSGELTLASSTAKKYPFPVINHIFYHAQFELKNETTLSEKYLLHSIPERVSKRRNSRIELKDTSLFFHIKSAKETNLVFEYKKIE
jgi:ribosomal-protein-serine acetyltransferase